ncbi:TauD/TfdA family dioxygenase (plasmid) [Burkholderia sp. FERM BP-3421]|jgi:gamma-butyrobetaine dioxygenase|uniref:TauD/TfdA family dioxygenase n=1 Tax=Burkholderia sp. FERM BP-3421 TaxID=1494466 RepID=UPI00235F9B92|nr:TauD/TfdA family dioxygenase [Burkholderia sp. FERM BP-3421]WDD90648.1 TauD/TfdA family dioxygenase [Burkholderia sp. FERM BP-3421]
MLTSHHRHLQIDWQDGRAGRYHWVWLRQACRCDRCFNNYCHQRHFDPSVVPADIQPTSVATDHVGLRIVWRDGHVSTYALDWLRDRDYGEHAAPVPSDERPAWRRWPDGAPASMRFDLGDALDSDAVLQRALQHLFEYGIVVLKADSAAPGAEFGGVCRQLAGFLDRSYFGEFFDLEVKADEETDSVSFSTKALPLHTDIPYCSPPPDYQFLYGLDVSPRCALDNIGNTRFVDGYTIASELREATPAAFEKLANTPVLYRAEYPKARKVYEHRTPIIRLTPAGAIERLINNPTKMFFDGVGFDDMLPFFDAYQALKTRLVDTTKAYTHAWSQGDMVVWDNRRIFHGRGDFGASGFKRTLRGGYFREGELRARSRFLAAEAARRPVYS